MRSALNSKIIASVFTNFGVLLAIVTTTLLQARGYLKGFYYGDPFDGRLMVVLHEHWWHFLRGERPFLNTYFFYPYDRGLGYSDTFFLQGFFYSFARLLDFDLVDSWALATISILALSNIGLALLAKILIHTYLLRLSFIVITGSSFTFFTLLNMHPNVAGYGLVSFLAYFGIKFFSSKSSTKARNIGLFGLSLTFPILLLSAWYAAFFSAVYIFLFIVFKLFHDKFSFSHYTVSFLNLFRNLNKINISFSSIVFTSLTSLWLYIYLPVASNVDRSVQELREGSPKFEQLANGSALDGGLFRSLYTLLNYENIDEFIKNEIGVTLSLFLTWFIIGIFVLVPSIRNILSNSWIAHVWIISTVQILIFLQLGDFSLFEIAWVPISPLQSIRDTARILILFSALIILLVHSTFDKILNLRTGKSKRVISAFTFIILLIIFVDQIRLKNVTWQKDDYVNDTYFDKIVSAQDICDSFYLDSEGEEWWNDQLDAMVLSARLNFPTVNGYSGGYPDLYPSQSWRSRVDFLPVAFWLSKNKVLESTCIIRKNRIDKLSTAYYVNTINGFDLLETLEVEYWWWSKSNSSTFTVINLEDKTLKGTIQFTFETPKCQDPIEVTFTNITTNEAYNYSLIKRRNFISIPVSISALEETRIKIDSENLNCSIIEGKRELFFSVKNLVLSPSSQ